MNPNGDGKPESVDPDQLLRMMELEMNQQRLARQHAGSPYRGFRVVSFIFLFAVIVGALLAFYYVFYSGALDEMRSRNEPTPAASPASNAP